MRRLLNSIIDVTGVSDIALANFDYARGIGLNTLTIDKSTFNGNTLTAITISGGKSGSTFAVTVSAGSSESASTNTTQNITFTGTGAQTVTIVESNPRSVTGPKTTVINVTVVGTFATPSLSPSSGGTGSQNFTASNLASGSTLRWRLNSGSWNTVSGTGTSRSFTITGIGIGTNTIDLEQSMSGYTTSTTTHYYTGQISLGTLSWNGIPSTTVAGQTYSSAVSGVSSGSSLSLSHTYGANASITLTGTTINATIFGGGIGGTVYSISVTESNGSASNSPNTTQRNHTYSY